jgi:hypothetical protein
MKKNDYLTFQSSKFNISLFQLLLLRRIYFSYYFAISRSIIYEKITRNGSVKRWLLSHSLYFLCVSSVTTCLLWRFPSSRTLSRTRVFNIVVNTWRIIQCLYFILRPVKIEIDPKAIKNIKISQ